MKPSSKSSKTPRVSKGFPFLSTPKLFLLAILLQIVLLFGIAGRYWYVENTGETFLVKAVGVDPRDLFRGDYAQIGYGGLNAYLGSIVDSVQAWDRVYVVPEVSSGAEFVGIRSVSSERPLSSPYFRARVSSISYDHPKYQIDFVASGNAPSETVSFVNENEWVSEFRLSSKSSSDPVETRFSTGSGVLVARSSSGMVEFIFASMDDCKNNGWYPKSVEKTPEDRSSYCADLPKATIVSVSVTKKANLNYGADRFFVKEKTGRTIENELRTNEVYAVWKVALDGTVVLSGLKIGDEIVR